MFTQFRVLYPQGCLITELLTINHGKYIVRALAQVDGVNLVTGMAAADTIEQAEDQARTRALNFLGIHPNLKSTSDTNGIFAEVSEQQSSIVPTPISQATSLLENKVSTNQNPIFPETSSNNQEKKDKTILPVSELKLPDSVLDTTSISWEEDLNQFSEEFDSDGVEASQQSNTPELQTSPAINAKPVATETKGRTKRSSSTEKLDTTQPSTLEPEFSPSEPEINTGKASSSTPVDLSEVIAGTTVQMKRLGWTKLQGREYLLNTYNKPTRADLTPEELLEFFNYLESLPNPED